MTSLSPLEYKIAIVSKELDTAFDAYSRHYSQITNLRSWTLTILLAYMGFLITLRSSDVLVVTPFVIVVMLFVYLEAGQKQVMDFDGSEVRGIEAIFMETDPTAFAKKIEQYEFRDIRLNKMQSPFWRSLFERTKHSFSKSVVVWYGFQVLSVIATYLAVAYRVI